MLREILAITGKPGLFKIVNHSGKTLIVEEMTTGKRFAVSPRDRVVSLGDVAMYTEDGERPLGEILDVIFTTKKGEKIDMQTTKDRLKEEFAIYVPDFDNERVHDSDIKKLFNWYNLLVDKGLTEFKEKEEEENEKKEDTKN